MASFNKVILIGNLTRDPEIRVSPSGAKVADLRLAVSETWRDRTSGETREVVCYVDIAAWSSLAEFCARYFMKGSPLLVEGRLQMDEWTTQQGEKRSRLRVRADAIKFVGPRRDGDAAPSPAASQPGGAAPAVSSNSQAPMPPAPPVSPMSDADDPDDLPF